MCEGLFQFSCPSPLGPLTLVGESGFLRALLWETPDPPVGRERSDSPLAARTRAWLADYFTRRAPVVDLPLGPRGTPHQQRVWAVLATIPPGTTRTYGSLARMLKSSPRAVGQAVGANPLPILIPCHRVVAVRGMGGYSGRGGVESKRRLLLLEGWDSDESAAAFIDKAPSG
ncbi:MAG: methylated-DNA--[protein]-cysteine S-methyltransferase [Magnetococcales bacterium]|nr:methylated-DNA--[protein]-cysteine S-methyltransferase [Magnetococcales bacterium]